MNAFLWQKTCKCIFLKWFTVMSNLILRWSRAFAVWNTNEKIYKKTRVVVVPVNRNLGGVLYLYL